MNKREIMLRNLSAAQFRLWEIHLYLDTHPGDLQMVETYNKACLRYKAAKNEFEENCYSLTSSDAQGAEWLKGPWPWEYEECGC